MKRIIEMGGAPAEHFPTLVQYPVKGIPVSFFFSHSAPASGAWKIFNIQKLVNIFQFSFFDIMDFLLFDRINRMDRISILKKILIILSKLMFHTSSNRFRKE